MPIAVPCRRGAKSRRMIKGTAMLPTVMATPMTTVPATTSAGPPAERSSTPASTPTMVSVTANSAPNFRAARDASGAASEKHSTGMRDRAGPLTGTKSGIGVDSSLPLLSRSCAAGASRTLWTGPCHTISVTQDVGHCEGLPMTHRLAILDDYQDVAHGFADF